MAGLVGMAAWWTSMLGMIIIGWTLREIFMDLFQPSGSGSLSSFIARWLFRIAKHFPSTMRTAGPFSIVVVISCWALLLAVGFALIYWARFPEAFSSSMPESRGIVGRFWVVLYFSLSSLTTLASGQVAPRGSWIRIVTAMESLIGVSLLTASTTWIVLIYPALGRMRALSRRAANLIRVQEQTGIDLLSGDVEGLLGELAADVIRVRVDFIHFPLIYYFHADTEGASLARSLSQLNTLSDRASKGERSQSIGFSAAALGMALSDIAAVLSGKFVPQSRDQAPAAVFEAVRRDHLEREYRKDTNR